jgi:hypothetical protein
MNKANAERVRMWAKVGEELIDEPDVGKATRYLLALMVNLMDQHSMVTQNLVGPTLRRIRVLLWISTIALIWIALVLTFK